MRQVSANQETVPAGRRLSERGLLGLLLLAALLNGLVFVFLVPPWQHYDEPTHFEVAWLAAQLDRLPRPGDSDPEFSRAVVTSMVQNRFYGPDTTSGLPAQDSQVTVPGYPQLDEPPAYYLLASLPLRLLELAGFQDVALGLRAARLASLLLFVLTVFCAWGIIRELTRPGHPLRWMVPLSLALLPGFADLMTAVNNDVGAVAVSSLFLWGAVRLVQRPFSFWNLAWSIAAVGLAYLTKITALYTLVLLPVALLLALTRGSRRPLAWAAGLFGGLVLFAAALSWGDAATWARNTFQAENTRFETPQAPLGGAVFQLSLPAGSSATYEHQLHQLIALPEGDSLQGKTVTVGAWIWADAPVTASAPLYNSYNALEKASRVVELTTSPQFFAFQASLGGDAQRNFVSLAPLIQPLAAPLKVYYDGLVVAEGQFPLDQAPEFDDPSAQSGAWGGAPFRNLLRNASAETSGLRLRPWVDRIGVRILPDKGANQPSVTLYYLLDQAGAGQFQRTSLQVLFRTFWGRFGWGHVPLLHPWAYGLVLAAVLLGLAAALAAMIRLRKNFPWAAVVLLGLALLVLWLQTILRGSNYATQLRAIYYPTARYAFPVIIPSLLFLNLGWYEAGRWLKRLARLPDGFLPIAYTAAWLLFDLYALLSIALFY
jgi:hypothetical protein